MKLETEKIEVSADTARLIKRRAEAHGISVDEYLRTLIETTDVTGSEEAMSEAEIEAILAELAADGKDLPRLPDDFSTKDIYSEHD
jgi:hypothetical protein